MPKRQLTPPASYLRWRYFYDPDTGQLIDRGTGEELRGSATRNTLQYRMGSRNFAAHRVIFKLITFREAPSGSDVRKRVPERRHYMSYPEWHRELTLANRMDNLTIDKEARDAFDPGDWPGIDRVTRDVTDYAVFHDASFEPSLRTTTPSALNSYNNLNQSDPLRPRDRGAFKHKQTYIAEMRNIAKSAYAAAHKTKRIVDEHAPYLHSEPDIPHYGLSLELMRRVEKDADKRHVVNAYWRFIVDLEHAREQVAAARRALAFATPTKDARGSVTIEDDRDTMGESLTIALTAEGNYYILKRAFDVFMERFFRIYLKPAQDLSLDPERPDNLFRHDHPDNYIRPGKDTVGRVAHELRASTDGDLRPYDALGPIANTGIAAFTPEVTERFDPPTGEIHPDLEDVMAKLAEMDAERDQSQSEDTFITECKQRLHGYMVNAFIWDDMSGDPSRSEKEAEAREFNAAIEKHTSGWFAEWVRGLRRDEDNNPVGTVADLRPEHMESIIRTIQHVSREVFNHKRWIDPDLAEGGSLLVAIHPAEDTKTPPHTTPESFTDHAPSDPEPETPHDNPQDEDDIDPLAELSDLEDTRE